MRIARQFKVKRPTLGDRPLRYVSPEPNTGCWLWFGAVDQQDYGRIGVIRDGKLSAQRAHRVSYELFVGPVPKGDGYHGAVVCHRCDSPYCVNPDHLFVGSQQDNLRDMTAKGRRNTKPLRHQDATAGVR